jgi:hypothetical protein
VLEIAIFVFWGLFKRKLDALIHKQVLAIDNNHLLGQNLILHGRQHSHCLIACLNFSAMIEVQRGVRYE